MNSPKDGDGIDYRDLTPEEIEHAKKLTELAAIILACVPRETVLKERQRHDSGKNH